MLRLAGMAQLCAAIIVIGQLGAPALAGDYGPGARGYGAVHQAGWQSQRAGRADDPLVSLGQKLFFDTRFSATGKTGCATCHNPNYYFAQPSSVSTSDNGQLGRRNAPSLLDVAFFPRFMWDGRFRSLEQQAFGPFQSGEMGIGIDQAVQRMHSDRQYVDLFRAALGAWPTPDGAAHALATFQRTLVPRPSRVDRFIANNDVAALTPLERNGYEVFTRRAGCSRCHQVSRDSGGRPLFTDFQFHNIGIGYRSGRQPDTGRHEQSKNPTDWGAFRTPSLRHSAKTPPYMHDGSLGTLEEVVEFYSEGGFPNPNLSPLIQPLHLGSYEKAALVAFLRALGD